MFIMKTIIIENNIWLSILLLSSPHNDLILKALMLVIKQKSIIASNAIWHGNMIKMLFIVPPIPKKITINVQFKEIKKAL